MVMNTELITDTSKRGASKHNAGHKRIMRKIWDQKVLYAMMLPGIIWYIVYRYAPMAGLILGFKDFNFKAGIFGSKYVGLLYFRFIFFESADFWQILRNTLLINIYKLIFSFPAPIVLAVMINGIRNKRLQKVIQTSVYLPHFVSWVVFGSIVMQFLSLSGSINSLLKHIGIESIYFMTTPKYFRGILVASDIWKTMGWNSIVFLAAITGIDPSMYEASTIDGCGKIKQVFYITIPSISETIIIMLLLTIGRLMDANFDQVYVMYNSVVMDVGDVISTYVYRIGIGKSRFSLTTAVGLFQSVVGLVLIGMANATTRKLFDKSIW